MRTRNRERNFETTVEFISKEDLSPKEKVMLKDVSGCEKFDTLCQADSVIVNVAWYAILNIRNDAAQDRQEYQSIIVVDKDGTRYITGSDSFISQFEDIYEDLESVGALDQMTVEVFTRESNKRPGKYFITCRLV